MGTTVGCPRAENKNPRPKRQNSNSSSRRSSSSSSSSSSSDNSTSGSSSNGTSNGTTAAAPPTPAAPLVRVPTVQPLAMDSIEESVNVVRIGLARAINFARGGVCVGEARIKLKLIATSQQPAGCWLSVSILFSHRRCGNRVRHSGATEQCYGQPAQQRRQRNQRQRQQHHLQQQQQQHH